MNSRLFHTKWLRALGNIFYMLGVAFLIAAMAVNAIPAPRVSAAGAGAIWTTAATCANPAPQDQNQYDVGQTVHIRGSNFLANTLYYWRILAVNVQGKPVIASGTTTTDATGYFCVEAHTVLASEAGAEYNVEVDTDSAFHGPKQDNYKVATPTATQTPTNTPVPPTNTPTDTLVPPTSTPTNTSVPPTSTPTNTLVPPTNTPTDTQVPPTSTPTDTPVPPTSTPTDTPVPPTNTPTDTQVPPTSTPTDTPVPPTNTPTDTLVPPTNTATDTPVPPTNTPTDTLVPPTSTPTNPPQDPTSTPTIIDDTPTPITTQGPGDPTSTGTPHHHHPQQLIPVTGADLGGGWKLQTIFFNLGIGFLGLGLVLNGLARERKELDL